MEMHLNAQPKCSRVFCGAFSSTFLLEVAGNPPATICSAKEIYVEGLICYLLDLPNYLGFGSNIPQQHFRPELSESIVGGNLLGNTAKNSAKAQKGHRRGDSYLSLHK